MLCSTRLATRWCFSQSLTGLATVGLAALLAGCSHSGSSSGAAGDGSAGAGATSGGGAGAGGSSMTPDASFTFNPADASANTGGTPGVTGAYPCLGNQSGACVGQLYMGQSIPTDIFVMFDQSGSMAIKDNGTTMRIDAVRDAVDQFMKAPGSAGLGIGIGYFGSQPLSCMCTSCDPKAYATPAVPIGVLPAQETAVMGSLRGIQPTGETPTGAAIRGACTYATGRKVSDPTRNIVILLVTDGEPGAPLTSQNPAVPACNPTLDDAVAAATECAAGGVSTYVLGVGPSLDNLNRLAAAGHTKSAYLVAGGGTADIVKALEYIRSDAMIPCTMQIPMPAGTAVDFQKVNVVYADSQCKTSTFLYVNTPAGCNAQSGGWYYDNAMAPTQIQLCGASCDQVKAPGGQLVVSVGCMTKIIQ